MSAASNIPQELFSDILWYVLRGDLGPEWPVVGDDGRNVSSCGRVCRHWALPCRLKLFDDIILRSADDVQELRAMLDSPPPVPVPVPFPPMPPLCDIIRVVRIDARDDQSPWMHLVWLSIIPKLRVSSPQIRLYFTGSHPGEFRITRNNRTDFYRLVPRSIPSMAPVLTRLVLKSVHFNNGAELCRLLASYPTLTWIYLYDLTWTTQPTCEDFHSLQLGSRACWVRTQGKKDSELPAAWFILALIARTEKPLRFRSRQVVQGTPRLHPEDFKSLVTLLAVLRGQDESTTADGELQEWWVNFIPDYESEMYIWIEGKRGDTYLIPHVEVGFTRLENTDHTSTHGQPVHRVGCAVRIARIEIDYVFYTDFHSCPPESDFVETRYKTSDWGLLTSTLQTLPYLREAAFGFPTPSTPDDLLKAHGSTTESLLHHDQLTVKCDWTEHKYDPVKGCMDWVYTELDVKVKAPDGPDTTERWRRIRRKDRLGVKSSTSTTIRKIRFRQIRARLSIA